MRYLSINSAGTEAYIGKTEEDLIDSVIYLNQKNTITLKIHIENSTYISSILCQFQKTDLTVNMGVEEPQGTQEYQWIFENESDYGVEYLDSGNWKIIAYTDFLPTENTTIEVYYTKENIIPSVDGNFSSSQNTKFTWNDGTTYELDATGVLTSEQIHIPYNDCPSYENITKIEIGTNITSIEVGFARFLNLSEVILPANSLTELPSSFLLQTQVTSVDIPPTITKIGSYAFKYTPIVDITIPDSVTEIGSSIFDGCSNLESITLSPNITTVEGEGSGMFNNCSKLAVINCNSVSEPFSVTVGTFASVKSGGILHVASGGSETTYPTWTNEMDNLGSKNWSVSDDL